MEKNQKIQLEIILHKLLKILDFTSIFGYIISVRYNILTTHT
jgi:hypothetical protein